MLVNSVITKEEVLSSNFQNSWKLPQVFIFFGFSWDRNSLFSLNILKCGSQLCRNANLIHHVQSLDFTGGTVHVLTAVPLHSSLLCSVVEIQNIFEVHHTCSSPPPFPPHSLTLLNTSSFIPLQYTYSMLSFPSSWLLSHLLVQIILKS